MTKLLDWFLSAPGVMAVCQWLARSGNYIVTALVLMLVIGVGVMCTFASWDWLRSIETSNMESRSTTLRNIGLVYGGALALLLAGWRGWVADQQSRAAQHQAETAQKGLLNERYQQGAVMLGNSVLAVRLAGIYALQRLAEDNATVYHIQVMRLLCSFVRDPFDAERSSLVPDENSTKLVPPVGEEEIHHLPQDVQAAIDAISACHSKQLDIEGAENFWLDLHGADLRGANLVGRDLSYASPMNLEGVQPGTLFLDHFGTDLSQSKLHSADLLQANLSNVDFSGAELHGANFALANLSGAKFSNHGGFPAKGLTQEQLNSASDSTNAPMLSGVLDADTDTPLEWRRTPPADLL